MRFEPGKVYQSNDTKLKFLCIADVEWINASRRTMYYFILRGSDGVVFWSLYSNGKWDYKPSEMANYHEVEE
jgi:hypothetical protein